MHRVTQTIKSSNTLCVNSRLLLRNYVQKNTSTLSATSVENNVKQQTDMKKFRNHHSTLSQPTVQEIDMKNIEPSYFLDCDILKSIVCMSPVNCHVSTSHIRSLYNWMRQNQGHFYCSETAQSTNTKKTLPVFIELQKSDLLQHEKEKILKEMEFLLPVPDKCILELIEASWIRTNALSSIRPKGLQTPLQIQPIDTVVFLTKDERLFNFLIAKQEIRQCINEILQRHKISDLIRILPLSSLDLKSEVCMTE
jgi:hypothetical protein